jgi:hypothetical protein
MYRSFVRRMVYVLFALTLFLYFSSLLIICSEIFIILLTAYSGDNVESLGQFIQNGGQNVASREVLFEALHTQG